MMHNDRMRYTIHLPSTLTLLLGLGLVGCGDPPDSASQVSIWIAAEPVAELPLSELGSEVFFDHPWQSDLRLASGNVKLTHVPNPRYSDNITSYVK